MKTFKVLGLLLTYPEGSIYRSSPELLELLRTEAMLPQKFISRIERFLEHQNDQDLLSVQEDYVNTFDRGRAHCLHLFEHIHGESRNRGQAMADLTETYAARGLYINSNELPDYLPLFMEYLSRCPLQEASELLGEAIDIIALIATKLNKRKSPYAVVFDAIEALSAVKHDKDKVAASLQVAIKDPQTLEQLDEQWREAEAFSGISANPMVDCNPRNAFPNATQELNKIIGDT